VADEQAKSSSPKDNAEKLSRMRCLAFTLLEAVRRREAAFGPEADADFHYAKLKSEFHSLL
jgi:hypothetical protein